MTATGASGPQIEKVQPLNFHEGPVDHQVVARHQGHRDEEVHDGFRGNPFFLFFLNFCHLLKSPLSLSELF